MTSVDNRLREGDTLIFAQSKLVVAAREVLPPDASRPSIALGVPGLASESSFTACSGGARPVVPLTPADTSLAYTRALGMAVARSRALHLPEDAALRREPALHGTVHSIQQSNPP